MLLVEDDGPSRELAQTRLVLLGYQVEPCANGHEALALLEAQGPFDLVVTDLDMPHMSGEQLIRWLRENPATAEVPIIVLSTEPESGIQAGAHCALRKPYHLQELADAIGETVASRATSLDNASSESL